MHRLMIHHPPMIHFCYVNNFLRNTYFFMKKIFLDSPTSSLSIVKFSKVLEMFPACHILFKSGISFGISRELITTQ